MYFYYFSVAPVGSYSSVWWSFFPSAGCTFVSLLTTTEMTLTGELLLQTATYTQSTDSTSLIAVFIGALDSVDSTLPSVVLLSGRHSQP